MKYSWVMTRDRAGRRPAPDLASPHVYVADVVVENLCTGPSGPRPMSRLRRPLLPVTGWLTLHGTRCPQQKLATTRGGRSPSPCPRPSRRRTPAAPPLSAPRDEEARTARGRVRSEGGARKTARRRVLFGMSRRGRRMADKCKWCVVCNARASLVLMDGHMMV